MHIDILHHSLIYNMFWAGLGIQWEGKENLHITREAREENQVAGSWRSFCLHMALTSKGWKEAKSSAFVLWDGGFIALLPVSADTAGEACRKVAFQQLFLPPILCKLLEHVFAKGVRGSGLSSTAATCSDFNGEAYKEAANQAPRQRHKVHQQPPHPAWVPGEAAATVAVPALV